MCTMEFTVNSAKSKTADEMDGEQKWKEVSEILLKRAEQVSAVIENYDIKETMKRMLKSRSMKAAIDHGSNLGSQAQISYACHKCAASPVKQKDLSLIHI